jgi:hypothetical protein
VLERGQQSGRAVPGAGRLTRPGVVVRLPSHEPAPFDQQLRLNLIIEHYRDPPTFRPAKSAGGWKNLDDLRQICKDHEFMLENYRIRSL